MPTIPAFEAAAKRNRFGIARNRVESRFQKKEIWKRVGIVNGLMVCDGKLSKEAEAAEALSPQALHGCSDKCGNLTIPYPFGMEEGCYLREEFFIYCNGSTQSAYLMGSSIIVTNISLEVGEMQISKLIGRDCYDEEGNETAISTAGPFRLVPPYTISDTQNKFYAVGCDTYATMEGFRGEEKVITGCISICNSLSSVNKNSCSGIGCCQINIPSGLIDLTFQLTSFYNHMNVSEFNPCSYAFIAEQGQFNFNSSSFLQLSGIERLPMVLNWAIGNDADPCDEAQNRKDFACKANSKCFNPPINESVGYLCRFLPGYEGNPYHSDGCKDIDECKDPNLCQNGQCLNLPPPQNYTCSSCHKGYKHDGTNDKSCIKDDPERRSKIVLLLKISLGVSMSFLVLFLGISWMCWGMKKREFVKLKEKHFKENGGILLLQQLASHGSSMKITKIFTAEELEKATDNYHESTFLGEGGYGTVYKGILPDDTVVAIKKSKGTSAITQSDQFVNEVIILSQINHRNVVKLLGTDMQTLVLGTFGYLDPEYLQSNQLTEKSDVYNFGVVLVELITSKVPLSKDRCLASIFVVSMEEDWLDRILDDDIVNEGNIETVKKVANLAKRCLRVKGEERPTMKEVTKALEEMSVTAKHPWGFNASFCGEESEYLLGSLNSDDNVVEEELFQPGDTSLPQTSDAAPISHPNPATALEILKRDFHSFREQVAKEKAKAEAYRVRIAELEKEQFLLRATLEHRNVYNDSLDRVARVAGTPDALPSQGQTGFMLPGRPSQIIYVSHPLTHPSFPLPAPQPSPIPNDSPLRHQPNPSAQPISTSTTANSPNPPLDMPTRLLLQLSQTVTQLASRIEGVESRRAQRPLLSGYGHRLSPFTPRVQMNKRPPGTKPFKMDNQAFAPTRSRVKLNVSQSEVYRIAEILKTQIAPHSVFSFEITHSPLQFSPTLYIDISPDPTNLYGQGNATSPSFVAKKKEKKGGTLRHPATPRESRHLARTYSPSIGLPLESLANQRGLTRPSVRVSPTSVD
ncbi:hypothetical protein ACLB2K_028291 [Fragaria x ananassa]